MMNENHYETSLSVYVAGNSGNQALPEMPGVSTTVQAFPDLRTQAFADNKLVLNLMLF